MENKKYRLTKKIAKHGNGAIQMIPSVLKDKIRPKMLVKAFIEVIDGDKV